VASVGGRSRLACHDGVLADAAVVGQLAQEPGQGPEKWHSYALHNPPPTAQAAWPLRQGAYTQAPRPSQPSAQRRRRAGLRLYPRFHKDTSKYSYCLQEV